MCGNIFVARKLPEPDTMDTKILVIYFMPTYYL